MDIAQFKVIAKKILPPNVYATISKPIKGKINLERVDVIPHSSNSTIVKYLMRSLSIVDSESNLDNDMRSMLYTVILWSDISKFGRKAGGAHNIQSAEMYLEESNKFCKPNDYTRAIYSLIKTHGLIGQAIRGECAFRDSLELKRVTKVYDRNDAFRVIYVLNKAIIGAVDYELWNSLERRVSDAIANILDSDNPQEYPLEKRVKKLRSLSLAAGEPWLPEEINESAFGVLSSASVWYVESALGIFNFQEFQKIMAIATYLQSGQKDISFELLMEGIHYNFKNKRETNVYAKRIIEKTIADVSVEDILKGNIPFNEHLSFSIINNESSGFGKFEALFSPLATKLIELCLEAEKVKHPTAQQAIIMLYDLFGFRKDKHDWLGGEKNYLETMNSSLSHKSVIADYVVGDTVVDVGPGGGALLKLIEEKTLAKNIIGIDISSSVIETLKKTKEIGGHRWDVAQLDIMNIDKMFSPKKPINTIIFCSILHELFSYIPFNGKKFNPDIISHILKKCFKVLAPGGRVIIRDGVKTEPNENKLIKFKNPDGVEFFKNYAKDFKGRVIQYEWVDAQTVRVPMNDAMEVLYTYTWGAESYAREVQEMFGLFSPFEYARLIQDTLGDEAQIIKLDHFLQPGYEENLLPKIDFLNEDKTPCRLPDSTCIVVIEKKREA